jgi:hypothetical protein
MTDFGTRDSYAAAMKGVILGMAPKTVIVDVTHEIEPHNIAHGAFVLRQVFPWFPEGTIHVAVVDPGVGSERRILLGQYAGQWVIAPDNGLLTFLHRDFPVESMRVVEERRLFLPTLSSTFHGRDIMAPVAAHLANGLRPRDVGRLTDRIEMLSVSHHAEVSGGTIRGAVLYIDRFGTLITNIPQEQLAAPRVQTHGARVIVNGTDIGPVRASYSDVGVDQPAALVGSSGYLEVAVNRGRAVERFGPTPSIIVEFD